MWTEKEIAWMAGLFEGEGCVTLAPHHRRGGKPYVRVSLGMTDADVVERLFETVKMGSVDYNKPRPNRTKPMIYWRLGRREEIKIFLTAIAPEMGTRRSAKIEEALTVIKKQTESITCPGCGIKCDYSQNRKYCTRQCGRRMNDELSRRRTVSSMGS